MVAARLLLLRDEAAAATIERVIEARVKCVAGALATTLRCAARRAGALNVVVVEPAKQRALSAINAAPRLK